MFFGVFSVPRGFTPCHDSHTAYTGLSQALGQDALLPPDVMGSMDGVPEPNSTEFCASVLWLSQSMAVGIPK